MSYHIIIQMRTQFNPIFVSNAHSFLIHALFKPCTSLSLSYLYAKYTLYVGEAFASSRHVTLTLFMCETLILCMHNALTLCSRKKEEKIRRHWLEHVSFILDGSSQNMSTQSLIVVNERRLLPKESGHYWSICLSKWQHKERRDRDYRNLRIRDYGSLPTSQYGLWKGRSVIIQIRSLNR